MPTEGAFDQRKGPHGGEFDQKKGQPGKGGHEHHWIWLVHYMHVLLTYSQVWETSLFVLLGKIKSLL